ncbi:MAG TPA: 3-isopropylmalate dehydrogenase [Clostridia bacterium]|nr:3-isopropylmalate dehydrogenase [Clostridia bacterium]
MNFRITVLPGDGIGPEVTRQAVNILSTIADAGGYTFTFVERPIGGGAVLECGSPLPQQTLDSCLESDAVLLGAVGGPAFDSFEAHLRPETGLLNLRRALGCFANLRPAIAYESVSDCSPLRSEVRRGADILVVRELLGGLYFGEPRGHDPERKLAFNTMSYTEGEIERVAIVAFEKARERRRKVISVDKANVLETSRLWRSVVTRVAEDYPDVTLEHALVDSFAMQLVTTPARFDVIITENLFGDILSDEAAVITGSLGLLPSASIGGAVDLYEPIHGSAPDIAGKHIANPIGAIASAAMLLRYSAKLSTEADAIEFSIVDTLDAGYRSADLIVDPVAKKLASSTEEIGAQVKMRVADRLSSNHASHAV